MKGKVLVTGAAGFIGFHLSRRLLSEGFTVMGVDNLNDYYSVELKRSRLEILTKVEGFHFTQLSLEDQAGITDVFSEQQPDYVINLAAQAGVRYSLENPHSYISSNVTGFLNVLEGCRYFPVKHLIFASSSSVYGANTNMPFSVQDNVDHPISLYAATKKSNELMAHTYSALFDVPSTGLRFFTVYGPWGRPDMALFKFTRSILKGEPIEVYNHGRMKRDFTYVEDIVEGIVGLIPSSPEPDPHWDGRKPNPARSFSKYQLFNIGNNSPVQLEHFISVLEDSLGKKAIKEYRPIQPGDVPATYADISDLSNLIGFEPKTSIEEGIPRFVEWYREHYSASL